MARLLTQQERIEITGYKRGADQARWFRNHGYYVECNARGIPLITHEQIDERRRTKQPDIEIPAGQPRTEPNVVAFRQLLNRQR